VKGLQSNDFGNYRCISKNSLGETEGSIRLYGKTFVPFIRIPFILFLRIKYFVKF